MKRTLLLLALVVGIALAEEEEAQEEGKTVIETAGALKLLKAGLLAPLGALFNVAVQVVILIALVLLITTLKASTGDIFDLFGKYGGGTDYEYYHVPAYESSGGSSYTGYSKRSVDNPSSFMDLPIVQRLAERVQTAIENFDY